MDTEGSPDDDLAAIRAVENREHQRAQAVAQAEQRLKAASQRAESIVDEARERSRRRAAGIRAERLETVEAEEEAIRRSTAEQVESFRRWSEDSRAATAESFATLLMPRHHGRGS